ncbi:MAG: right-handed parallel beta-helix repeat-containing protein [Thermoplasmata archaeon]|nr:right-handed parallel beta-helix repeat-containing protein [Thermoplasmata archaeon]
MRTPRSSIQAVLVVGALVITSLLINPNRATAGTPVQGPISTDTSWTADGSPYWVEGDVVVLSPANLTVEPGVEVLFNGLYAIYVEGVLYSVGTPASAIDFTSNLSTPSPGDWKGLQVNATGRATIRHTNITYSTRGIVLEGSPGNIVSHSSIAWNSDSGIAVKRPSWSNELDSNTIRNNSRGILLDWNTSSNTISNNNISFNEIGMECDGCGPDNIIERNDIHGNGIHAIQMRGKNNIIRRNLVHANAFGVTGHEYTWCCAAIVDVPVSAIYSEDVLTDNSIVDNRIIGNNGSGIVAFCGSYWNAERNHIQGNEIGISTHSFKEAHWAVSGVNATHNVVVENDIGVQIVDWTQYSIGDYSLFTENDFIENALHVDDEFGSTWSDVHTRKGNFWSGFSETCPDWERDGTCDFPYFIGFDEQNNEIIEDSYPLKFPAVWRGPQGGHWPVADADGPYFGQVGKRIQFNGQDSLDPDGAIVTYYWDLGDGDFGGGSNPERTYWWPATYSVLLVVWDDDYMWGMCNTTATIAEGFNSPHTPLSNGPVSGIPVPLPGP